MNMMFGKAIEGGRALSDKEVETLARDQLQALRDTFAAKPQLAKCDDVISQRLAEELRLVSRMIELVENRVSKEAARELELAEEAIDDLADVIEADDKCDAIDTVDPDMARRMTRRSLDGRAAPCDNRRPSILRKTD